MNTEFESLALNDAFVRFVDREFEAARDMASVGELAIWAFGDIPSAVLAWQSRGVESSNEDKD